MDAIDILWDRLAGTLQIYVENYLLQKGSHEHFNHFKPSYSVDYKIENIEELFQDMSLDGYWGFQIAGCRDINTLPPHLQALVIQFLPRFFEQYPEYKNAPCLTIRESF